MAEHPDLGPMLRAEADRHVPDRDAILIRVVRRRSEPGRNRWAFLALRPVAAAASVVATLVLGVAGIRLIGDRPAEPPAASGTSAPARSPSSPTSTSPATPSPATSSPATSSPATSSPVTSATRPGRPAETGGTTGAPPGPQWTPVAGFLSSAAEVDAHSNETWAQGNLVLTTAETITALDVLVSVARTGGVAEAGRWSSVPTEMIDMTVTEEKDALLYRFTLHPGVTLAPGEYTFAVQYQHAAGKRDARGDSYGVIASAGEKKAEVSGAF